VNTNTNDLTAHLSKNKKFQMLKKLKEEKERKREMVVRNVSRIQQPRAAKKRQPVALEDDEENAEKWFEEQPPLAGDRALPQKKRVMRP
jgi:hypothetical protein